MSHYGDYPRAASDQLSTSSRRNAADNRQPLSPISAQQQAIMEAKRSYSHNIYSKPPPSYSGILPTASDPDSLLRRGGGGLFNHNDDDNYDFDARSISSSSSSFFRVPPAPSFASSASFANTARLDSSVSDWIDQNRQHFPHDPRRSFSRSATPLLRPQIHNAAGSYSAPNYPSGGSSRGGILAVPSESGFASSYAESIIPGSSIDAASQLRQRHVMAPHAEIDNDDASSVYTLASQAPSIAPSVVAPSIASTATYHNAPEVKAVDDVEMMDLDASMSSKNQTGDVSSCISDSDISSDALVNDADETTSISRVAKKPLLITSTSKKHHGLSPQSGVSNDHFIRKDAGILSRVFSSVFRLIRLAISTVLKSVFYLFCAFLFLFILFLLFYTSVYLWTHHRDALVNGDSSGSSPSSIDLADIREAVDGQLYGQSIAGKRIIDVLESLVNSDAEGHPYRKLLSFHGSTGVGKTHSINVLKAHLPAGAVNTLYPNLVVHDLESHDESASTARSALLRDWLSTRLLRSKDSPFRMFVVENADAHPELVEDVAVAIKDALQLQDAELVKALDMRRANGLTDALDDLIDWAFGVPKIADASELLKKRKLLFVVVSNVGFRHINALTYKATREAVKGGAEDRDVTLEDSIVTSLSERESPFFASLRKTGFEPEVVPFLPLQKDALRRCLLANREFIDATVGRSVDEVIEEVIGKAEFFPRNDPTFSVSGCKRIASLLLS